MNAVMYGVSTTLIAAILLVSMLIVIAVGHRIGRRAAPSSDDASRNHINAIPGSILGILSLLLGFTFSLSLQRYDNRSEAVVDKANAIGTAYQRAQLLPAALRAEVDALLRTCVDIRVDAASVELVDRTRREALFARAAEVQAALWAQARRAAALDPNPVTTGLRIQARNGALDRFGRHDAALNRHVRKSCSGSSTRPS
jgi:hypothetical protein